MRHGIKIGPYNTWDDFHLTPTKKCVVQPPIEKTITLNVPGMNGYADLSASITGYPIYKDRTGSWTFYLNPGEGHRVWDIYHDIARKLAKLSQYPAKVILDDEPVFYYLGKVLMSGEPSQTNGLVKFTLKYQLSPIKYLVKPLETDWLWDELNFETDLAPQRIGEWPVVSGIADLHASGALNLINPCSMSHAGYDTIWIPYSDIPSYLTLWASGAEILFSLWRVIYTDETLINTDKTFDAASCEMVNQSGTHYLPENGTKTSILLAPKQETTLRRYPAGLFLTLAKKSGTDAVLHCEYKPGYV